MSWEFYDKTGALKQAVARAVNPMARVWRSTAQNIASGAFTTISFDSILFDTDGMWNPATPTYLTIKTAGKYLLVGNFLFTPAAGGNTRFASVIVNGAEVTDQQGAITEYSRMSFCAIVDLAVGDRVSLGAYQDSGSTIPSYPGNGANTLAVSKIDGVVYPTGKPPRITTSLLSGGPPSAPDDGDIWIATAVDASDTRWQFQYNAGSASAYKWDFIGGPPIHTGPSGNVTTASTSMVDLTGAPTLVIPRTGLYIVDYGMYAVNGGTYAGAASISSQVLGSVAGAGNVYQVAQMTGVFGGGRGKFTESRVLTAGETIKIQVKTSTASDNLQAVEATLALTPIRIA